MKSFLAFSLALLSLNSFASEKIVLSCTTPGDALSSVDLVEAKDGRALMKIHRMDDSTETFSLDRNFRNVKASTSDTFIGTKESSIAFGGAISDAALLRVLDGAKAARLAVNGVVYVMTCSK